MLTLIAFFAAAPAVAAPCAVCHGPAGISRSDQWPNLAGQKRGYLVQSLKAYRSGARNHSMMNPQARRLSDKDIAALAAFYASLPLK